MTKSILALAVFMTVAAPMPATVQEKTYPNLPQSYKAVPPHKMPPCGMYIDAPAPEQGFELDIKGDGSQLDPKNPPKIDEKSSSLSVDSEVNEKLKPNTGNESEKTGIFPLTELSH